MTCVPKANSRSTNALELCYCSEERTRSSKKERQWSHCFYEGGGEGKHAKEANGGREWLYIAAIKVYGGVEVGL